MNNTTTVSTAPHLWSTVTLYLIYIIQGSVVSLGNLLIVISIACYEALRNNKEYVLLLGLSLADCINMTAFFFAGIYRLTLLLNGTQNTLRSAWECMTLMQNTLWSVGMWLSALMLTVLSTDRLFSVLFPLSYLGWTASYARRFVACVYMFCTMHGIYYFISAYNSKAMIPANCMMVSIVRATTNAHYASYASVAVPMYASLSVVLYGFVMLVLRKRFSTVGSTNGSILTKHPHEQHELKRQRKITVTLLFSALCTLFLFVIPFSVAMYLFRSGRYIPALFLWCVCNLNPFANVLLYPLRHKEIKQALIALLKCRHMPADLKTWSPQMVQPAIEMPPLPKTTAYVPRGARANEVGSRRSRPPSQMVNFGETKPHVSKD